MSAGANLGQKGGNELAAIRRELADLRAMMRRVPSRFPSYQPDPLKTARVLYNFAVHDDVSEAEDTTSGARYWIDYDRSFNGADPFVFGDGPNLIQKIESNHYRSAGAAPKTRDLYAVVSPQYWNFVSYPNALIPDELEWIRGTTRDAQIAAPRLAGSRIQTTINGTLTDNLVRAVLKPPQDATTLTGFLYDWTQGRKTRGGLCLPDVFANGRNRGGFACVGSTSLDCFIDPFEIAYLHIDCADAAVGVGPTYYGEASAWSTNKIRINNGPGQATMAARAAIGRGQVSNYQNTLTTTGGPFLDGLYIKSTINITTISLATYLITLTLTKTNGRITNISIAYGSTAPGAVMLTLYGGRPSGTSTISL
jgi:hypothetical protein